ncbi:MAG: prolipoprotein diacylglyceryl transferase [Desulfobulbaceae bacterium]|nr:prolipoprotein diacylglyceryl transferase [Desulfobulbaceae bacterium]
MVHYPQIDPVIFSLGPLQVRWYGLMYILGFAAVYLLVSRQIRKYRLKFLGDHFEDLNFVLIIGLILGARLGYVIFYNTGYYLANPGEILAIWQGGMSFHGALLGLVTAAWLFCRKKGIPFLKAADLYAVTVPIGLGLGRIGNFINGELYGRVSEVPWSMIFPAGGPVPRHPSQLYEFLLEGVLLFIILWSMKSVHYRRGWPAGTLFAAFLIGYGLLRSFAELFREPDIQLGFLIGPLTMGQTLSSLMVLAGFAIIIVSRQKKLLGEERDLPTE